MVELEPLATAHRRRLAGTPKRLNPLGNARLTAVVGLLLLAPVVVEAVTILLGVHTFMSLHVFVGLALIPPVLLKLASTGWRFTRYYTRSEAYVEHGTPQIAMRLLAPVFVVATVVLFSSGVAMGSSTGMRSLSHADSMVRPPSSGSCYLPFTRSSTSSAR